MAQELQPRDPRKVGPYWLLGRLGAGGMGQVFLGRSPGGRLVAVKVVRAELAGQAEFRTRFAREVAAARKVSGLFTAPVVDADVGAPVPWLATAYVPGLSLAEAITGHGPLPAGSVLALAAGLAEGLGAIHAAGIVHRDLKPPNVLLAEDGPRVIDFGISRAAEASLLTGTGVVFGSPSFMSPEQARGHRVGPPSDVFSLGALLTFAATGQGPFGTGSSDTVLYRVVFTPPDTSGVPAELRPLVERCLAKDPAQRPGTAQLLAELGTAPPTSGWLPAPITQAFPVHPPSEPLPAEPAAADVLPAPPVTQSRRAPRRRTRQQNADGDPGGYAAACRRRDPGARRPARRTAAGPLPPRTGQRHRGGRADRHLSHCGHDRAPASVQQGVIRALAARTSDHRSHLERTAAISGSDHPGGHPGHVPGGHPGHVPGGHPGHVPGDLPGHVPGDHLSHVPGDLPRHVPGDLRHVPGHVPGDVRHVPGDLRHVPSGLPGDFPRHVPGGVIPAGARVVQPDTRSPRRFDDVMLAGARGGRRRRLPERAYGQIARLRSYRAI